MLRASSLALALALGGCIEFDRGGAYACDTFDECASTPAEMGQWSCFEGACLSIAPLGPGEKLGGWTEEQAALAWAKWLQGLPLATHPLYDGTGEQCANGQPGDAFFLAGTDIAYGGSTTRSCTVPAGRPLVFPLFWWVIDNNGRPPAERLGEAEMKDWVLEAADSVTVPA